MPCDKLVDSAQLDGALTATADAIRAKTGGSAKIAWDASAGFSSVISGIQTGGKIAEGEFTPAGYSNARIHQCPVTISGLAFKPSRIIFYVEGGAVEGIPGVLMYDSDTDICVGTWNEYDEDDDYVYYYGGAFTLSPTVTFTSNGFTISATEEGEYGELSWYPYSYRYIAFP